MSSHPLTTQESLVLRVLSVFYHTSKLNLIEGIHSLNNRNDNISYVGLTIVTAKPIREWCLK